MTSQECLGGKIDQIWFGLISINRKNQKKNKETKNTVFQPGLKMPRSK